MVAFDAPIAAPNAMFLDYPLLRMVAGGGWIGFLSDAIRMYADLLVQILQVPGPVSGLGAILDGASCRDHCSS